MGKHYERGDEEMRETLQRARDLWHMHIEDVTVGLLCVRSDDPDKEEQVLKHAKYPAAAMVKIISAELRAAGMPDAMIIVDGFCWDSMTDEERLAVMDHELFHIDWLVDAEGTHKRDRQGRPKLSIRLHDRQYGWFDAIAARLGRASAEVRQARQLADEQGQLYLFGDEARAA